MPNLANAQFLEELYEVTVANALLVDENTGLELYSASLESHAINQTASTELVKAGQNNETFLELKKDKEISIELTDIQQKRDWEALKLGGTLESRMIRVRALPKNYTIGGASALNEDGIMPLAAHSFTLDQTPIAGSKPTIYNKKTNQALPDNMVTINGKSVTVTDDTLQAGDIVFVGSFVYETEAEAIDFKNEAAAPSMRLELDIPVFGADNRIRFIKKVVFYKVSLGEEFSMEGSTERTKQTTTTNLTVLKHADYDSLGFIAYIPVA